MLYGKVPWFAENQQKLINNIKSQPLIFDENVPRSLTSKELIRGMLNLNEKTRLSWE